MLRPKPARQPRTRPRRSRVGAATHGLGAFAVSALFFAAIGLGFLYLRLSEGPVSLGPLAGAVVERLNASGDGPRFQVDDVVFALGADGETSGLRLRDVTVLDEGGAAIARAPEIGVRFRAWDAMRGDLAPTRIRLDRTEATLRRDADGRFSFSFDGRGGGAGEGASFFDLLRSAERDEGALRKLRRVEANDVTLTYDDQATGRRWTAEGVDIAVWRLGDRLYGSLAARTGPDGRNALNVALSGARPLTGGATTLTATFSGAEGRDLAAQVEELGWLEGVRAPISGALTVKLGDDGELFDLEGRLDIGAGEAVSAGGARIAIRSAALSLDYDAAEDRFHIPDGRMDTEALSLSASGSADVIRGEGGAFAGLVLQTDLRDVTLAPPGVFAAPLDFDAGRATARLRLAPFRVELGEARLTKGETLFTASGLFAARGEEWRTELDFAVRDLPATELPDYWPAGAASGAREWTARNIRDGLIERIAGFARVGGEAPGFALDFVHSGTEAHVIAGMSPILRARGTGHLDPERFVITVDDGDVELDPERVIAMDGSSFLIGDVGVAPAPAEARLKAKGAIIDILDLIDQEPLRLTSKFGADLSRIEGQAELTADLAFPLVKALTPAMVDVEARATLTGVRYPTGVGGLVATGGVLDLAATPRRLDVSGPISLGGLEGDLAWREILSAPAEEDGPRTAMTLATRFDAPALERLGLDAVTMRSGGAPATLTLTTDPGEPLSLALTADLGPARFSIPSLGVEKGEGAGALSARGVLRNGLNVSALRAEGPGFLIEGAAALDPSFALRSADLSRFEVGDHTALAVSVQPGEGGGRRLDVRGRRLDLGWLNSLGGGNGGGGGMQAEVAVERLRLTDDLTLRDAKGSVSTSGGATEARIAGRVNGGASARFGYAGDPGGGGKLRIDAADAGAFLRDLGYFRNGHGGVLGLDATLGPGGTAEVDGELAIDGIVVREAPTLAQILSVASLIGLFDALQSGGITFSEVRAPFRVRDGRITLDEAKAVGPNLGIKMDGVYDSAADRIDMSGVLSPAYALNALLSNVPIVGEVLGGEGEGLFAFTFRVRGSKDAPQVTVNPLSVLTPGALRNVFTSSGPVTTRPSGPVAQPERPEK